MIIGRFIGWLLLAASVAILAWDAVGIVDTGKMKFTKFGEAWFLINQDSALLVQPAIERHVAPWLWNYIVEPIWLAPAALVFFVLGLILAFLFRRRAH